MARLYKEKAWYAFTTCLNELEECFQILEENLHRGQKELARQTLHQMGGTAQILEHAIIIEPIQQIQSVVRSTGSISYPYGFMENLGAALDFLIDEVNEQRPYLDLCVYAKPCIELQALIQEIQSWPHVRVLIHEINGDSLLNTVRNCLPDVLIIAESDEHPVEKTHIASIQQKLYGTAILTIPLDAEDVGNRIEQLKAKVQFNKCNVSNE